MYPSARRRGDPFWIGRSLAREGPLSCSGSSRVAQAILEPLGGSGSGRIIVDESRPASPAAEAAAESSGGAQVAAAPGELASRDAARSGAWRATPWVASTYFAEGLPFSIVHQVSAQLFTALGASLGAIGLTSLYGLAWNLKFSWSPLVDRLGTPRRWVIGTELALAVAVGAIAWPAAEGNLAIVARLLAVVALLSATHDIAVDGFYLRALGARDQAALSGLRVAAYRLALLVGNGVLVALAGRTSWLFCFLAAAVLLLGLAAAHALALPGAAAPRSEPGTAGASPARGSVEARGGERDERPRKRFAAQFSSAFTTFLRQPKIMAVLGFILLFRAGDALLFAMSTPLLRDIGLDTAARGLLSGVAGTAVGIAGSIAGGALIARRGLARTLTPIALVQSLAIPLYAWLAWARPSTLGVAAVVLVEQLAAGVGTAGFMVFLMRRCSGDYKASHFAIASALMSVAMTLAGSVSGYLAARVGFTAFFLLAFAASIPGVILSRVVPKD